METNFYRKIK